MSRSRSSPAAEAAAKAFAIEAARLAADLKCEDVVVFDVRELSQVCDYIIVGSGTSERQMRAVAHQVEELGEEMDHPAYRSSADTSATWIVTDFVDVVVHLFEPDQRLYYDLETLWSDAPRVNWRRPGDSRSGRRGASDSDTAAAG